MKIGLFHGEPQFDSWVIEPYSCYLQFFIIINYNSPGGWRAKRLCHLQHGVWVTDASRGIVYGEIEAPVNILVWFVFIKRKSNTYFSQNSKGTVFLWYVYSKSILVIY